MKPYTQATPTIEADHKKIRDVAGIVTQDCFNDEEKAIKLFYFVRDMIKYNVYMISVFIDDFLLRQGHD
jgi:transglutaminase-like putative cysteine protease